MKKLKFMSALLVGLLSLTTVTACDDDKDKDTIVSATELPTASQTFVSQYYGSTVKIVKVKKEIDKGVVEYDVTLSNRHEITFNAAGEWIDVDAPTGETVPEAIVPVEIREYVETNYPSTGINEISKEVYGYDVDLTTGVDLMFDSTGGFIGIDR